MREDKSSMALLLSVYKYFKNYNWYILGYWDGLTYIVLISIQYIERLSER